MKQVKAMYHDADDNVIGQVKFDVHYDGTIVDESVIYDNAPEGWKCCCWDEGKIEAKLTEIRKKVKSKKAAKKIADAFELDLNTVEDNGDLD